ncbi:TonB-dependent receptor [Sphingobium baderi]|uniref:TonB-dependent receptor n=2 Tax=Sphingobium baderi TaxID=1332080 RepID=A0A0S3EV43_9SPHN|nr:TonB-dependent receptor [Sphingobium baderi]
MRDCLFWSAAIMAMATAQTAWADDADGAAAERRSDIIVTGIAQRVDAAATGLPLTLRETPQSVTIIDRERIDDFALTNVNDLLDQVVGINVERTETDRTEYDSRGFDITNFQVDGIGLPLRWGIQFGDLDTALFETVEAVRGANAIMTGVGNPSATINYARKRPTKDLQISASTMLGSWDHKRFEADVSGPLNATGTVSARLIYAHDDHDSYLDNYHVNRNVYGAIVVWDITPQLTATTGYTRQENDADGVLWGALPLLYSNGERVAYPSSASTAAPWTYWNVHDQSAYGELAYAAEGGWNAKARFTYNRRDSVANLLYAYGYPDEATGLGVSGVTGIYTSPSNQYLYDAYASGPVTLFGRRHQLAFGLSTAKMDSREYEDFSSTVLDYPAVSDWAFNGVDLARPSYPGAYRAENVTDRLTRAYGAMHLNLADRLKAVVGASAMWLKTTGDSYFVDQYRKDSKVSPYAGLVFDVTGNVSLYASYTDIFNPQKEADATGRRLAPAKGTSIESGIKSEWFDKKLYVSAALFKAKQDGLADAIGVFGDATCGSTGPIGDACYAGVDTTSEGFEIEVTGRVTENWSISGGYTGLRVKDQDGNPTRTFVPRRSLKLATTYEIPELRDLKLGAQFRWQSKTSIVDAGVVDYGIVTDPVTITQSSYAVLDLMAGIRLVDHLRASVNVRNVTGSKYLGSLKWGQAFYAAPRSVLATLSFSY